MQSYTDRLKAGAADFHEHQAYDKLPQIIASFRGSGAALDEFLTARGFPGSAGDSPERKAAFLKERFVSAGIGRDKARYAAEWLTGERNFDRRTGFRIAFAFGLDIDQTNEFFRTVMLDRGFDCHTIDEAIFYYCIFNGKDYPAAERLLAAAPKPKPGLLRLDDDVLYTQNIISFIRKCRSEEELLEYFRSNLPQFGYNHVKATEFIRQLWNMIASEGGLAAREKKPAGSGACLSGEPGKTDSVWEIYLQILGLEQEDTAYIETDRTIRPILENKTFMHEVAAKNFPSRQGIEKILRGEKTDDDTIRKTLILLAFYSIQAENATARKGAVSYAAGPNDRERCLAGIDQYLMDAGFPELYPGNPFDWIFIWASGREAPLLAFRYYIQFLSAEFSERRN